MVHSDITNKIIEMVNEEFENPYPEDIFRYDNKKKMDISRGRFNEFISNVVNNTKNGIIKIIEDSESD